MSVLTLTLARTLTLTLTLTPTPTPTPTLTLTLTLTQTLRYTLPGLAAAVVKHTAPGGVAYLMCAKGRPGVEALPAALQATYGGVVEREEMSVMNSFGACEVVLITYTAPSAV